MKTLKSTFYLALSVKKTNSAGDLTGRLCVQQPSLARGEIAMKLTVEVPQALFSIPTLNASVRVPNDVTPAQIDATVIDNVQEVLRERTGLDVIVSLSGGNDNG